jgi:hypothetical protein
MMQVNDDLFDDQIRKKLKGEISFVPEDINKKIDKTVENAKKRRFNVKKVAGICSIFVIGTLLLGIAMPTYASNIPFIGSMLEKLNYKNYENYGSDLNITKESNGLKATINKVIYDGLEIAVFYTVKSEEPMESEPKFIGAKMKINGNELSFPGGGESGEISDDKRTYVGVLKYTVGLSKMIWKNTPEKVKNNEDIEIPNEFVMNLEIDNVRGGKWSFDIPVTVEKINNKVKEKVCNIDLKNGYNINKIITTPINTELEGILKDGETDNEFLQFYVFDDKGRHIIDERAETYIHPDKEGNSHEYLSYMYKPIYEDTESLTFIPYIDISRDTENSITAKLNLKGETKLYSDDGKEYATITKIETINQKTKIYYKSQYGVDVSPINIKNNKTGDEIIAFEDWQKNAEEIIYRSSSDEYVVTCDKAITEGDYSVKMIDKSKSIKVYNDDKFTINIK